MILSLTVEDIAAEGLEAATVKSIVKAADSAGEGMALSQLILISNRCGLSKEGLFTALDRLQEKGVLNVKETPQGKQIKAPGAVFRISDACSRRLRQYGVLPAKIKSLKEDFTQAVPPQEQTQQSFLSFALNHLKASNSNISPTWTPPSRVLNHLRHQGVEEGFIQNAVFPFLENYDPERGGGNIEANFIRFVASRWQSASKEIPDAWLPTTDCNSRLLDLGYKQQDILLSALEFRLWAKERRFREQDWDQRFLKYIEKQSLQLTSVS